MTTTLREVAEAPPIPYGVRIPLPDNLRQVELPGQPYTQYSIGSKPNPDGHKVYPPFWIEQGFDGVHFIGAPNGATSFRGAGNAGVFIGHDCGYVVFENITFFAGDLECVFAGWEGYGNINQLPAYVTVHFINCRFVGLSVPSGNWGVMGYDVDLIFEGCVWYCELLTEHGIYPHGFAKNGVWIRNCRIKGAGAEGWKFTCRPSIIYYPQELVDSQPFEFESANPNGKWRHAKSDAGHFTPEATILIENSLVEGWGQPHSWRGGAAVSIQSANARVVARDLVCANPGTEKYGKTFMMEARGEYFDKDGNVHESQGRSPFGNQKTTLERVYCVAPFRYQSGNPRTIANFHGVEELELIDCGFFGEGYVGIKSTGKTTVRGCNTDGMLERAREIIAERGWPEITSRALEGHLPEWTAENPYVFTDGAKFLMRDGVAA